MTSVKAPDPLDSLFAQLKAAPPQTSRLEFGFETRLLARLRQSRRPEMVWSRVSWRLLPVFALAVGILTFFQIQATQQAQEAELVAGAFGSVTSDPVSAYD